MGTARPKLAAQVAERLLSEIWSGRWRPGDRLPTESEMEALFGVSRTPIREAMQSLRLLGVVDISPRRGATIRALPVESVMDLAVLSGLMSPRTSVADVRRVTSGIPGAPDAALREHGAILAAVADRDAERARRAAVTHIRRTRARYERAGS